MADFIPSNVVTKTSALATAFPELDDPLLHVTKLLAQSPGVRPTKTQAERKERGTLDSGGEQAATVPLSQDLCSQIGRARPVHRQLTAPGGALRPVFINGEVTQHRALSIVGMNESDSRDIGLDDMNLLQRRDDE